MAKPTAKPNARTRKQARAAVKAARRRGRRGAALRTRSRKTNKGRKDASDPPAPRDSPRGKKGLTNAEKSVRDTLIVERVALGWPWADIAAEAGLSQEQCKRNYKARIAALPKLMEMDPLKIVELLVQGFQSSVIDFEKMAQEYADRSPNAAVGAKKAAVETRKEIAGLLQATGQLPNELGTLRHLYDIRVTVQALVGLVDRFVVEINDVRLPKRQRRAVLEAAAELRGGLRELAGGEESEAVAS